MKLVLIGVGQAGGKIVDALVRYDIETRVKGHGVGADAELGATVMVEDADEVLARVLKRLYTEPVYGLGVLPGRDEGGIYTLNAARSFRPSCEKWITCSSSTTTSGDARSAHAAL